VHTEMQTNCTDSGILFVLQDLTAHPKPVLTSTTCTVQNMYRMSGKIAVSIQSMCIFSHICIGSMSMSM